MNYNTIIIEIKNNYALICLNRPDKLNALNNEMFDEIEHAVDFIASDKDIDALIITGKGEKAFAAGADIVELNKCYENKNGYEFSRKGQKIFAKIFDMNKPVIAAVNGFALGGGFELALACHIRFASENAKFGCPEVKLGIIPGYGATQRLPKLVGTAKAIELIISGDMLTAEEALKVGIINSISKSEDLLNYTEEFVKKCLLKGIIAVNSAIEAVKISEKLDLPDGLEYEAKLFGNLCSTEDFKESTNAFIEKRNPIFRKI